MDGEVHGVAKSRTRLSDFTLAALNIRSGPLEVWGIVVQSLSRVLFFMIPRTAAHQASRSGC